jgi:hypothetical protein
MPGLFTSHDPYGDRAQRVGRKSVFEDEGADEADEDDIAAAAEKLGI